MTYDAVFLCSVALLRGHVLQAGAVRAQLLPGRVAFDQAHVFVETVGEKTALMAAHRAMKKQRNGAVRWL